MSDYRNPLTDYSPQMEVPAYSSRGFEARPAAGVFTEDDELDLAARLLDVGSEPELDFAVDGLVKEAERALNETLDPPMEQDIGSILKKIAKVALPIAGGAVGGFFGGPAGAMLGGSLGSAAGNAFGLELEGLSPEDSEFEVGKQFVRLAATVVQNAADADPHADPRRVVHDAAVDAARTHAPGLIDLIEQDGSRPRQYRRIRSSRGDHAVHNLDRTQVGASSEPYGYPGSGNGRGMSEEEQMDLASHLMEMESEEDFSSFVDGLVSKGADLVGKVISSPTGQALGGVLKDAAKTLLPVAGQAVGSYFGGPTGGQIGGALGSAASNLFEAETDEQEWEAANVFVKVAVDAASNAAEAPPGADPRAVAHHAFAEAARRHAPHLMRYGEHGLNGARRHERHSGRWARHGRHIVVYGV